MKKTSYKVLRWIIDISFYGIIVGGIFLILVVSTKWNEGDFSIGLQTSQRYSIESDVAHIVSSSKEVIEPSLVATKIAMNFKTTSNLLKGLSAGISVLKFAYIFLIIFILRKFVHSLNDENPFTLQNVKRLQIIGILLLLIEPLLWIMRYFLTELVESYVTHTIFTLGSIAGKVGYWVGFNIASGVFLSSWITVGFIVLVIAEVFRQGLKMKEEQDLTI
jgi:hypothetical protein